MSLIVRIKKKLKNFTLKADFEIENSCLGILGGSGCGKSMTLKSIAGIVTPDEGYIELDGRVLFDSARKINMKPQQRKIGYLFQNYALFPNMTVFENIGAGMKGPKKKKAEQINKLIENFHLQGVEDQYPSQLSGGQQQRAALARILAYEPDVLLLDEPFSALDSYLKEELQFQLYQVLKEYKGDSIMVTHSRDEVYRFCEELMILDKGKVIESGETKKIFDRPLTMQAARLTGCKNLSPAVKISENQVKALEWNLVFTVREPIPEGLSYVGIRAHDFIPCYESKNHENVFPCRILRISEAPFEWNALVETEKDSAIWWKISKNQLNSSFYEDKPDYLTVASEYILLLI